MTRIRPLLFGATLAIATSLAGTAPDAAAQAAGECPRAVPAQAPEIPDGSRASKDAMLSAREAVENFVATGEAFLACRDLHPLQHNYQLSRIIDVADAYNRELEAFLERAGAEVVARR